MTVSAPYAQMKACPKCGAPLRQFGEWVTREGQEFFIARPVSGRRVIIGDAPESNRWTPINSRVTRIDPKTGIARTERVTEWHYLYDYECTRAIKSREWVKECPLVQAQDAVDFIGDPLPWMLLSDDPHKRPTEASDRRRGGFVAVK